MGVYSVNKTTGDLELIAGSTLYADAPIGAIIPYGGATAPSGWLLCQGQAVSRTTYAALFSAIGTAFGEGDGSSTFNLPDLRETIPVGTGTRASGVTAHDTYTVGQFKDDQMQNHDHYRYPNNRNGWSLYADSVGDQGYGMFASDSTSYGNGSYTGNVHTGRTGTTTHGKQLGVNYIIKAAQSAMPLDVKNYISNLEDTVAELEDTVADLEDTVAELDESNYEWKFLGWFGKTSLGGVSTVYVPKVATKVRLGISSSDLGGENPVERDVRYYPFKETDRQLMADYSGSLFSVATYYKHAINAYLYFVGFEPSDMAGDTPSDTTAKHYVLRMYPDESTVDSSGTDSIQVYAYVPEGTVIRYDS